MLRSSLLRSDPTIRSRIHRMTRQPDSHFFERHHFNDMTSSSARGKNHDVLSYEDSILLYPPAIYRIRSSFHFGKSHSCRNFGKPLSPPCCQRNKNAFRSSITVIIANANRFLIDKCNFIRPIFVQSQAMNFLLLIIGIVRIASDDLLFLMIYGRSELLGG